MVGTTRKWLTESLNVQGERLLVLDQVPDLAAVWGSGTLGHAALSTRDDEVRVRHADVY